MKTIGALIAGILIGGILTGVVIFNSAPGMMLHVSESRLGFDETVAAIETSATDMGWVVPKIYDLQASLDKAGHRINRLKVLSLCQPDHAYGILADDDNKPVTAMMPCRIGVYETVDGKVHISQMNIGLMSKLFGGTIEEVMGKVAAEEKQMLKGIVN